MSPEVEKLFAAIRQLSNHERLDLAAGMLREAESGEHSADKRLKLIGMVRSLLERVSGELAAIELRAMPKGSSL